MTIPSESTAAESADFTRQRPIPDNLVPDLHHTNAFTRDKVASAVVGQFAP